MYIIYGLKDHYRTTERPHCPEFSFPLETDMTLTYGQYDRKFKKLEVAAGRRYRSNKIILNNLERKNTAFNFNLILFYLPLLRFEFSLLRLSSSRSSCSRLLFALMDSKYLS